MAASIIALYGASRAANSFAGPDSREPVPAQVPMGLMAPELLKLMQIPVLNCHQPGDLGDIGSLVEHARIAQSPVAIFIDFQLMEGDA